MSKKAKPARMPADIVTARVLHEQRWAHERWLERLSWGQIRQVANLPERDGGLGYDLSESALKGLVAQARAAAGDLSMGRTERVERQLAEVDARARAARNDLDATYAAARKLDAAIANAKPTTLDEAAILGDLVSARRSIARELEAAERRLDTAQDREAKLVGLYAPTTIEATVTNRDGIIDDLNTALARLGEKPLVTPER